MHVVDYGGSLGSSYFQNRYLLNGSISLNWNIVEQKHFVDCGREFIQDQNLNFFYTIEEALLNAKPDVLLLSSVIQYLEKPYEFIEKSTDYGTIIFLLTEQLLSRMMKRELLSRLYLNLFIKRLTLHGF